ncbi:MAG: aminodeoxychorismate synthase component I [Deltaproteobacteria bacterium]|jgi:para-aminobenzoate synthetase component 1|nr:aminodeoxychorismate synthase component I [Deltaproteobacteria bacterium]
MEYCQPELLRKEMNRAGAARRPFLFAVNFEMTKGLFVLDPDQQNQVFYRAHDLSNKKENSFQPQAVTLKTKPLSLDEYALKFQTVMAGLNRGDSYLVNLTVATPIECSLSLSEIFAASSSPYQLYVPNEFVCFSPERFVLLKEGLISTCPMKGTINAAIPNAKKVILADEKESAEHATIVDLLRNDLSLSAKEVRVKRYRYVELIETRQRSILQVSSEIVGLLPEGYFSHLGDIVFRTLPCGSCSGAPKESTLDIIQKAEKEPRGFYTGVFGVFDGEVLDSAVLIRFIERTPQGLAFRSGGGITAYSDLKSEYQEALDKIYLPFV